MGLAVLKAHIVRGSRVVILNDPGELASAVTAISNANHCIVLRPAGGPAELAAPHDDGHRALDLAVAVVDGEPAKGVRDAQQRVHRVRRALRAQRLLQAPPLQ